MTKKIQDIFYKILIQILDDGTVICTPECERFENCETLGLKCPECLNGFCVDPECCDDTDCPVSIYSIYHIIGASNLK